MSFKKENMRLRLLSKSPNSGLKKSDFTAMTIMKAYFLSSLHLATQQEYIALLDRRKMTV